MRRPLVVVLVLVACFPALADRDDDDDDDCDGARRVTLAWPDRSGRDLQAVLDAAPDGARVELGAGVFAISRPLVVTGKRLTIAGAGSTGRRATRLVGPAPQPVLDARGGIALPAVAVQGLWNFVGADVRIAHVALSGFDAGIVSVPDATGLSGPTKVRDVAIDDTGRGILSLSPARLEVRGATISNTRWNGISVGAGAHATVQDTKIFDPQGAGIYMEGTTAFVFGVTITNAQTGGILGKMCTSDISDSNLFDNVRSGIELEDGTASIHHVLISGTKSIAGNLFGDAIFVLSSGLPMSATLTHNTTILSARASVSVWGAEATLEDNSLTCSAFDIDSEAVSGVSAVLHDEGGNVCGCNTSVPCESKSSMLAPPPPIAGLE